MLMLLLSYMLEYGILPCLPFHSVSKEKFSEVLAAVTALLVRGFAICVIIMFLDGQRKVVNN